jgi:DNA repair protein RecN (Recombination protein N)
MLAYLGIRDLAVVEALEIEFEKGFIVLTGETGAGKSILLTALGLGLGDRADAGFIRPGASRAEIGMRFDLKDSLLARQWLEENELLQDDGCLIRRIVSRDGRSKAYVNGRPVTIQTLQELGSVLVEIHGQHGHVQLLKNAEQRRLLDKAAGNDVLLAQVEALFHRWCHLREEVKQQLAAVSERGAREELLSFQIEEMEQQNISDLNYPALIEEHLLQANMGRILETGQAQFNLLYEDEQYSVSARLAQAINALTDLCHLATELRELVALLANAQVEINEASLGLRRMLESLEADLGRLDWLERRLAEIHRLARKHQVRPEELPHHFERLRMELETIRQSCETVKSLEVELSQVEQEYLNVAYQLSKCRIEAAKDLQTRISNMIRELGMPQGSFHINVRPLANHQRTMHGIDDVEFLVSVNPGLSPRPLSRVASGGELSRISLAVQVAVWDSKSVPTLIFDEVDTGIGGRIAEIVGQKLRVLGQQGRQVLCVTHLPQVAVHGHSHFLIEKVSENGMTQSCVYKLSEGERRNEVARMLGGIRITNQTLAHAEEMLNMHIGKGTSNKS